MSDTKPVYKRVNGEWVKQLAFERVNGEWVKISSKEEATPIGITVNVLGWFENVGYTSVTINDTTTFQFDSSHNYPYGTKTSITLSQLQQYSYKFDNVTKLYADYYDKYKIFDSEGNTIIDWTNYSSSDLTEYLVDGCYVALYYND